MLGLAGLGFGSLLGMIAVGQGLDRHGENQPSFAGLSANPDAQTAALAEAPLFCPDCVDSYGVAARLRAERDHRLSEPFRRLGEVDVEMMPLAEPTADYHYGGRLPDPEPREMSTPTEMSVPIKPAALDAPSAPVVIDAPQARQQKGPGETPEPFPTPE